MPHPLLETDCVECAHKGKLILKSSTKELVTVSEAGLISINDLAKSSIVGCVNNVLGVPSPCAKIINLSEAICSKLLEVDGQKIILAELVSQLVTDKGSALSLKGEPSAKDVFEVE